jgi:hypothetical protein
LRLLGGGTVAPGRRAVLVVPASSIPEGIPDGLDPLFSKQLYETGEPVFSISSRVLRCGGVELIVPMEVTL